MGCASSLPGKFCFLSQFCWICCRCSNKTEDL